MHNNYGILYNCTTLYWWELLSSKALRPRRKVRIIFEGYYYQVTFITKARNKYLLLLHNTFLIND